MSYTGFFSNGYTYSTVMPANGIFKLTDQSSTLESEGRTVYIVLQAQGGDTINVSYESVNTNTNSQQSFDGSNSVIAYYVNSAPPSFDGLDVNYSTSLPSGWTIFNGWQNSNTQQSGSQNITFASNDYVAILLTGDTTQDGSILFSSFLQPGGNLPLGGGGGVCFHGNSKVLMADGNYKKISEIRRNDVVIQDLTTKETAIVSRNYANKFISKCVRIKKNSFGNQEDVICTENHPIWSSDNQRRLLACNLPDVEKFELNDNFYNLQFDEEGTFIVEGMKVDSLSPYHKRKRLPYNLFIDKTKYISDMRVLSENQPNRNKPKLLL